MRIAMCVLALAILPLAVWADVAVGVDLETSLATTREKDVDNQGDETIRRTTDFGLKVMPSLIIMPSMNVEVVPTVGFSFNTGKQVQENPDGSENTNYEYTHFGMGGGCGLFLRPVDGTVFRLSLGPDVLFWYANPDGDDNDSVDISLGLRVNTDLLVTDRFFIRMSPRLVALGYSYQKRGADDHTGHFTFFDIATLWLPRLGFYFNF